MKNGAWNPDSPDYRNTRDKLDQVGMKPSDAHNVIAAGVESGIRAGETPDRLRQTFDDALQHQHSPQGSPQGSTR